MIPFTQYDDGADIVETAYLMEGVLFAREYFSRSDPEEVEIRGLADKLWRDVEWDWFVNKTSRVPAMIWHWSPKYGWKKNLYILGFNECQIVYVLALASPTHPIEAGSYWEGWESADYAPDRTEFGIHLELGSRLAISPPLFMTQFSYLGLDPHQIFFHGRSYFDHFTDFCRVQIEYAESKSKVISFNGLPIGEQNENTVCNLFERGVVDCLDYPIKCFCFTWPGSTVDASDQRSYFTR